MAAAHEKAPAPFLGLRNAALKKAKNKVRQNGGGRYERVQRDRVRERGGSCSADTLGGIRSKICWLGTLG